MFSTRQEAEDAVAQVIEDEPGLAAVVGVESVELEIAPNQTARPRLYVSRTVALWVARLP